MVVMPGPPARLSQRRGTLQQQVTTSQYGDFVLTDEVTGQLNALPASGVDLSASLGSASPCPASRTARSRAASRYWTLSGCARCRRSRRHPRRVYVVLPAMATTCSASVPQLRYLTQLCRTVLEHTFRSSSGSSR